jgi:hypothetical protein
MRRPVLGALCDLLSLSFIRGVRRVFAPRGFKKSGLSKRPLRLGQAGSSGRERGREKPPPRGIPACVGACPHFPGQDPFLVKLQDVENSEKA